MVLDEFSIAQQRQFEPHWVVLVLLSVLSVANVALISPLLSFSKVIFRGASFLFRSRVAVPVWEIAGSRSPERPCTPGEHAWGLMLAELVSMFIVWLSTAGASPRPLRGLIETRAEVEVKNGNYVSTVARVRIYKKCGNKRSYQRQNRHGPKINACVEQR
jgi:hypothetical protein